MTWMRRGLLALMMVGWVAACGGRGGGDTPPPTDEPGSPTPPQVISGSLKIHTPFKAPDKGTNAYAMLGDGTRFFKKLDASGVVTFEDPSLVGPQDVTVVAHGADGFSRAYTYLALERPEVWLPGSWKSPPVTPQSAYITGKVKGMGDPSNVFVQAVGQTLWEGSTSVNADGSFRLHVQGTLPAVVDLAVVERDPSSPFKSKAVGLKRGIALSAGQEVSGQEVVLDHPINQQTQLIIQGAEVYQQDHVSASLMFFLDGEHFFETTKDRFGYPSPSGLPASLPSFSPTAPFDTVRATLALEVGAYSDLPSGRVNVWALAENLSSVTVSLPKPMTLTSPTALGPSYEPAPVLVNGPLVFQWSVDAAAQKVEFFMSPDFHNSAKLSWTVTAPGSVTSFKPFPLRLDETSFMYPSFHGAYRLSLDSYFDAAKGHYADYFTQTPPNDPLTPAWQTSLEGGLYFR